MIDLILPLAVLVSRMPWQEIDSSLAHNFAHPGSTVCPTEFPVTI
jgi:hypothetical protein